MHSKMFTTRLFRYVQAIKYKDNIFIFCDEEFNNIKI